jgi:hypothetical protein
MALRINRISIESEVTCRVAVGSSDLLGLRDDSISLQLKMYWNGYQEIFVCEGVVGGRIKLLD